MRPTHKQRAGSLRPAVQRAQGIALLFVYCWGGIRFWHVPPFYHKGEPMARSLQGEPRGSAWG